ncbi:MAG: UDP-N-acetylglucosamine--N-acetylmuramyl-(pentapeptide) pyrophosphoryl-undecaprenol N-acetylglucosamine transferase [Clostridiales bacterium]|nr:UDP-N-acetylglucosamine--N-acetylmuramyl-(pentapeptide) pyrophosphoryl-undecaprenol N-acetylglucosamine transferase [Clostridiales bacterium]
MKTIAFAGGGTAGHVMPNLALIGELSHEYHCVYIGGDGMEKTLCASRGIPFFLIDTVKLRRDAILKNFAVPFKLSACVKTAKKVLEDVKPDLIFSKGGYAALPVVLAAKNIPVISHESDFSAGLATKLAKKRSTYVLCSFENCAKKFNNGKYCGAPLNQSLYGGKRKPAAYGLSGAKPILAVVGGSSGAAALNQCVASALPELLKQFDIIHVTGKNKAGAQKQQGYTPVEFENNMPDLYATCDIIVTRAGANALAECIALKIPTLAVPLEKASRGDQLQNAEYFKNKGAVKVLRESEMTPLTLVAEIQNLYREKNKYVAATSCISVDGTRTICNLIKDVLNNKQP